MKSVEVELIRPLQIKFNIHLIVCWYSHEPNRESGVLSLSFVFKPEPPANHQVTPVWVAIATLVELSAHILSITSSPEVSS